VAELRAELVELLPRLRRFARVLARDAHDADDLVQTAIERALAHAGQLRADAPLAGWMFGILRNAWIDEQRARGRRGRVFAAAESGEQVADPSVGGQRLGLPLQEHLVGLADPGRHPEEDLVSTPADAHCTILPCRSTSDGLTPPAGCGRSGR